MAKSVPKQGEGHKAPDAEAPPELFAYDVHIPLSPVGTLRIEAKNEEDAKAQYWAKAGIIATQHQTQVVRVGHDA